MANGILKSIMFDMIEDVDTQVATLEAYLAIVKATLVVRDAKVASLL